MSVSVAVENVLCQLAEGPHWEGSSQSLLYVDPWPGDIHRWDANTGKDKIVHFDGGLVTFVIPRKAGGYATTLGGTFRSIDWDTGDVIKTYGDVGNRLNDAKCDASGRLWSGSVEVTDADGKQVLGALYSLETDGTIREHLGGIACSNGLAWTPDNRTMFYVDSTPRKVYAFDFDLQAGNISNQRVFLDRSIPPGQPDSYGIPDGMCMDTEDKLWIACYGAGKVIRVDIETGKVLQTVQFPARYITSCCFGGKNYDVLYVTSACSQLTPEERSREPLAGSVFKVTGLGVKGRPMIEFAG